MNKKYKSFIIIFITIFFIINLLINSNLLINTFLETTKLWFYNLFPSIFIFFIISDILNNYNFPYYISLFLGKLIHKIYHLPCETAYIIIMSMVSGFPGNSKLIDEQLENNTINYYDANKLLTMTHFSNPLFIIYTIGINILKDKKIGIIILICHFITNFIIGFFFRKIYPFNLAKKEIQIHQPLPFMIMLKKSINNTIYTLINVFGIIIFFSLLVKTVNIYLNLNPFSNMLLNGLLEITNGLNLLSHLSLSKIKIAMLATFFISFGGISIHMQIISILSKYPINYYIYLIARILHASISTLLVYFILIYCN